MRLNDLTGKKYGALTVVSRADKTISGRIRWNCKCDCGNDVVVIGDSLKNGHTRSCGCMRHSKNAHNFIDLTGKTFWKLTVLERVKTENRKESKWLCRCECGSYAEVLSANLRKGSTKSCGCERYNVERKERVKVGDRFGRLVTIKITRQEKYKPTMWLCQCDCGNQKEISQKSLLKGTTKSCGCYKREVTRRIKFIDITGNRYGRLTVLHEDRLLSGKEIKWVCQCECGKIVSVLGSCLRSGSTLSCGCYQREHCGDVHRTHGQTNTRLYGIWCNMKDRTLNKNNDAYALYGAVGKTICDEWLDFSNFYHWSMKEGYKDDLTIDRIDNSKGYSPDNCRWATRIEQANNKTNNVNITIKGETHTIAEWCRIKGVKRNYIDYRRKKGIPVELWFQDKDTKTA